MSNEAQGTFKLTDIGKVEPIVREYARALAFRHQVKPEHFEVHLARNLGGAIMKMTAGGCVNIMVQWPEAQPQLKTILESAFKAMQRFGLRRTLEVVPVAYSKKLDAENKKWKKERFIDGADIVCDLIPQHRLRVQRHETITLSDVVTGEKVTFSHELPLERFDGGINKLWFELSRVVRDLHPEEETRYNDEPNDEAQTA